MVQKSVVVLGLGYVGLPLAQEAVNGGWRVTGLDVRQDIVRTLNEGRSHVDDLTGTTGRGLVPVLQQTGLAELLYALGIFVGLLLAG